MAVSYIMTTTFVMEQHPYLNWPAKKQQKQ